MARWRRSPHRRSSSADAGAVPARRRRRRRRSSRGRRRIGGAAASAEIPELPPADVHPRSARFDGAAAGSASAAGIFRRDATATPDALPGGTTAAGTSPSSAACGTNSGAGLATRRSMRGPASSGGPAVSVDGGDDTGRQAQLLQREHDGNTMIRQPRCNERIMKAGQFQSFRYVNLN